jgi:hypothetical protein
MSALLVVGESVVLGVGELPLLAVLTSRNFDASPPLYSITPSELYVLDVNVTVIVFAPPVLSRARYAIWTRSLPEVTGAPITVALASPLTVIPAIVGVVGAPHVTVMTSCRPAVVPGNVAAIVVPGPAALNCGPTPRANAPPCAAAREAVAPMEAAMSRTARVAFDLIAGLPASKDTMVLVIAISRSRGIRCGHQTT